MHLTPLIPAVAAIALAGLAACTDTTPAETDTADACGASALQNLVGQPGTVMETMKFRGPMRILHPGMAVTMDYRADRLNVVLAEDGWITRVYCG